MASYRAAKALVLGMGKERTKLRRHPERGRDDRALVHAILDEALVCHVGFVAGGYPTVIPTLHARAGDTLYLHGSPASRMLQAAPGGEICVTVTLLDGVVMARSAFNHSMNYRSVVVFGQPRFVTDPDEKMAAFKTSVERDPAMAYKAQLLALVGAQDPAEVLRQIPSVLRAIVAEAGEAAREKPAPGEFSLGELIGHMVDAQVVVFTRLRWILAEDEPPIPGYEQDAWVSISEYPASNP